MRLDRLYRDDPVYFITACTHRRQKLLANLKLHETCRAFCFAAVERHILVGRYVLMPDHVHLFVYLSPDQVLSAWMKALKNSLSKNFRENGYASPHWQKDYFDHVLRSENSYEEKWHYVRLNPVRAGLVSDPDAWPYQGEITQLTFD